MAPALAGRSFATNATREALSSLKAPYYLWTMRVKCNVMRVKMVGFIPYHMSQTIDSHPSVPTGIGSRTLHRFQNLHILMFVMVTQMVKNLPALQETWVRSLGWEDPLEEGMATHSSTLAWRIPWTEEPGRLQSIGLQRVGCNWATFTFKHTFCVL